MTDTEYKIVRNPDERNLEGIIHLFKSAGWDQNDPADLYERMVSGSTCFVIALHNKNIVGMARAIGDGANDAYIQDVFVLPEFRHRGLASNMVKRILSDLKKRGITWIALFASGGSGPLYSANGFSEMQKVIPMIYGDGVY
ncbi:MAG: GNAT family N-acetyltransferase [Elusimicrobiaceae bacterium]|jgi:ribosomal protein S18 acetylase RimI-like enzyme